MTKEQALQLGAALISWSKGASLEARDALGVDKTWYPFAPEDYEKLSVEEGIEWRTIGQSLLPSSKPDPQSSNSC
jgi:hypothetical protein